jgi:hypothetical protein
MVETGLEKRGLIINKCALLHGYPVLLNIECCLQGNLPVSTRDSTNMPNSKYFVFGIFISPHKGGI